MSYPTRAIDRTKGDAMYPGGYPTAEEHERMVDHAKATRINEARERGFVADYFSLREQDTYVQSSTVKSMMWDAADGVARLKYELGTIYMVGDGSVAGRVQIEERSPYPFQAKTKQGSPMCLALSRPSEPIESRFDEWRVTWSREGRLVETEEVSVHQGPHGIQWARVWDQDAVAEALSQTLDVEAPDLR